MVDIPAWAAGNWFDLAQTLGIIASLCLAAEGAFRSAKAREVENLLNMTVQHRELWSGVAQRPELARILDTDPALLTTSISQAEQEFLNLAFIHFQTGWSVAKTGALICLADIKADVRGFFSLPLPRAVWEKTKAFRNPKFVRFVERALGKKI